MWMKSSLDPNPERTDMAKVTLPPYRIGGPIEIGNPDSNNVVVWTRGTIVKMDLGDPMEVQIDFEDGTHPLWIEGEDFRFKRAVKGPANKIKMDELPSEVAAPLYKKALVDILRETNTSRPNATVQRVIHIVKAALGEMDS